VHVCRGSHTVAFLASYVKIGGNDGGPRKNFTKNDMDKEISMIK
jgi:hypothetical protein